MTLAHPPVRRLPHRGKVSWIRLPGGERFMREAASAAMGRSNGMDGTSAMVRKRLHDVAASPTAMSLALVLSL
jgi:hypothetical protein